LILGFLQLFVLELAVGQGQTNGQTDRGTHIGGFKGEAGEALPPQIFLTLKFVVCIALKIIEIVAT